MKNELYVIYNSIDVKEIGNAFPQVQVLYDTPVWTSMSDFSEKTMPPDSVLPGFQLAKGAKLTDFLTNNYATLSSGALISIPFFDILHRFFNPGMQFFPVSVAHDGGNTNYFIIHFFNPPYQLLDFKRTVFERSSWPDQVKEKFQFSDFWEFNETRFTTGIKGCVHKLYFRREIFQYDFFVLPVPRIWVINRKIAEELLANKISGIVIVPLSEGESFCEDKRDKIKRLRM